MKRRAVRGIGRGLAGLNGTVGNLLQGMEIRRVRACTGPIEDYQVSCWRMMLRLSMLLSCAVLAMIAQERIQPNLDGFRYPVVAWSARIQGTVEFVVNSEGIRFISGHPILAAEARRNLEKWVLPYALSNPLSVTYSFRLAVADPTVIEADEPIGDKFDRFLLRLFRRAVTRRIEERVCLSTNDDLRPAHYKTETKDGLQSVVIDIESVIPCIVRDVGAIAALRH